MSCPTDFSVTILFYSRGVASPDPRKVKVRINGEVKTVKAEKL